MGKVSVAQVQQNVPGNASREVFQGLFKDLGKQAMALEAILRAVCGRVDKMENWLTEVSFGMTELDLKLRNIAHNIDGTAAVDDEAQGPHRWAIPPADDIKPLAATVSRKLGTDKKAVRVTGMAAAILDRLASTSVSTPTAVDCDKNEKPSTKKKSKEKKHGTKKVKSSGLPDVPSTPSPVVVESVPPPVNQLPPQVAEPQRTPIHETNNVVEFANIPMNESVPFKDAPDSQIEKVKSLEEKVQVTNSRPVVEVVPHDEALTEENVQAENTYNEESFVITVTDHNNLVEPVPFKTETVGQESRGELLESDPSNAQSENSSSETSPAISPREIIETMESQEMQVSEKATTKTHESISEAPDINDLSTQFVKKEDTAIEEISPAGLPILAADPKLTPSKDKEPELNQTVKAATEDVVTLSPVSPANKTVPVSPAAPKPNVNMPATSSVSSILPNIQVEPTIEPFVLKGSAQMSTATPPPTSNPIVFTDVPKPLPAATAPVNIVHEANETALPSSTSNSIMQHVSPPVKESPKQTKTPEAHVVVNQITRSVEAAATATGQQQHTHAASEPAGPIDDPLLPHRGHRRSSKIAPRPSLSKNVEHGAEGGVSRLSGNKRGSQSRRTSVAPKTQQEHEINQPTQQLKPHSPQTLQSVPQESSPAVVTIRTSTADQGNTNEESGGSDSESSSNGSETSSDEEEHEEDVEAGAAVEEISKTMTALKKLKRAQMLSPEEEKELKERAHKKWFQLKGHIKEKQKKDVTNILLKRKKNVFTVSSRIELLEEKSREIFAALKQITNELREKNDKNTHENLRRRVADIEQSLQSVDSRVATLSAPAMEKVADLTNEVLSLRTTVQHQLTTAQVEATTRQSLIEEALANQRALVESLLHDVPAQLASQAELFYEKLKQQPDYTAAIENIRRNLRRKADLKLLKELEARLLGLDAENEDCLVRCLSCRKEVTNPYNEKDSEGDDQEIGSAGGGTSQLRKVNPGPSSARIYRSNVPFSAQPLVQESILEELSEEAVLPPQHKSVQPLLDSVVTQDTMDRHQLQSAGDSNASEIPPVVRVPSVKWSTPAVDGSLKRDARTAHASPLSLMNITATRAILSPDRPISAPVIPLKKKPTTTIRSKSVLKSLSSPLDPPKKD